MKQSLRKHTPGPPATSMAESPVSVASSTVVTTHSSHPLDPERSRQQQQQDLSTNSLPAHHKPAPLHKLPKVKDADRILKRPSSDTLLPPVKRKYRRRKLSSSNESSTSEAASNSSEVLTRDATQPISPVGPFSSDSSISRREETHQHNSLDNLDLLASVTQKMDTHLPGGRSSLPVSPNSVSSEGVMKQAEPERGRKRKSSTAHTGAAAGPPATVTAASAAAAVARLVIAYSSHYTMVYNMSPPLPTAVVVVLGPISLPRASRSC